MIACQLAKPEADVWDDPGEKRQVYIEQWPSIL